MSQSVIACHPSQKALFCDRIQPCRSLIGVAFCLIKVNYSYTLGISIIYYSIIKEKSIAKIAGLIGRFDHDIWWFYDEVAMM